MGPSKAKAATKAEKARMARIVELGCVACRKDFAQCPHTPWDLAKGEVHHLLEGGVRRGHSFTVGLCGWHHVGRVPHGWVVPHMAEWFGPSLYHDARAFHARYGTDDELLKFQNDLLAREDGK